MQHWPSIFEGMDRIVGFWTSSEQMTGQEWKRTVSKGEVDFGTVEVEAGLEKQLAQNMVRKPGYTWISASQLPFEKDLTQPLRQLDLFSEQAYLVLQVILPAGNTQQSALFYLYFRNDKSNFGISDSSGGLTTAEKAIIGRLAFTIGKTKFLEKTQELKDKTHFNTTTQQLVRQLQNSLNTANEQEIAWKNAWLDQALSEISQRNGVNYVMSEDARTELWSKASSFTEAGEIVKNTIVYICNLFEFSTDEFIIEKAFLVAPVNSTEKSTQLPTRMDKTFALLDRLEDAAQKVQQGGAILTSAEVGKHMDKAITAPAISDALKKNRVRILQLLRDNPEKWLLIRHHFKPLSNLLRKKNDQLRATS